MVQILFYVVAFSFIDISIIFYINVARCRRCHAHFVLCCTTYVISELTVIVTYGTVDIIFS